MASAPLPHCCYPCFKLKLSIKRVFRFLFLFCIFNTYLLTREKSPFTIVFTLDKMESAAHYLIHGSNISCMVHSGYNFQSWSPNTNFTWKVMSTVQVEPSQPSGFASRCDWVLGSRPTNSGLSPPYTVWGRIEILPRTVFLQSFELQRFHNNLLPCFPEWHKFVLIIGDQDLTTPKQTDLRWGSPMLDASAWDSWLKDDRVLHLFVEHLDTASPADRVTPIPVGFNPDEFVGWNPDKALQLTHRESRPISERPIGMVFTNRIRENGYGQWNDRFMAMTMCQNLPFCDIQTSTPPSSFLEMIQKYPFLLCVHGGGIDPNPCAFSALLAGVIPIIAPFPGQGIYRGLPVLFTDGQWNETAMYFTIGSLNKTLHYFAPFFENPNLHSTMVEKLMSQYWWDMVEAVLRRNS